MLYQTRSIGQKEHDGWSFIHSAIESYFSQCFETTSPFMMNLFMTNDPRKIAQKTHQIQYAKNLIGDMVGLRHEIKFDFHGNLIHSRLLGISQQKLLTLFYQNFDIKDFITHIQSKINLVIKEENADTGRHSNILAQNLKPIQNSLYEILGKSVATFIEPVDDSYTEFELNERGMIYILKKAKIIVDNNKSIDRDLSDDNHAAYGRLKRDRFDETDCSSRAQKKRRFEGIEDEG